METVWKTLTSVPLYQGSLGDGPPPSNGRHSDDSLDLWLSQFPFITKQDIRHGFPENFLTPELNLDDLVERGLIELEFTSGTSQDRVPLLLPAAWWDEQEARALSRNGYVSDILRSVGSGRRVTIAAPVCTSKACRNGWTPQAERVVENTLFIGNSRHPFFWSDAELRAMAAEALDWKPVFLDVDPVYGVLFARYCQRHQISIPSLRFIICSYEFVSTVHRQYLQEVFKVPVFNLYGSTETGHLLMEDEDGNMKAITETAWLEVVDRNEQGIGELVVTTLTNSWMPLLRYRIGDLVRASSRKDDAHYEVMGRMQDRLTLSSGRKVDVAEIDSCFDGIDGVLHYHLRQKAGCRFELNFVSHNQGVSEADRHRLRERFSLLLENPSEMLIEPIEFLISQPSGKFRLVTPADHALNATVELPL